jgi:hypothetical protein
MRILCCWQLNTCDTNQDYSENTPYISTCIRSYVCTYICAYIHTYQCMHTHVLCCGHMKPCDTNPDQSAPTPGWRARSWWAARCGTRKRIAEARSSETVQEIFETLGPIFWIYISAENGSEKFSASSWGHFPHRNKRIKMYLWIMDNIRGILGILRF